MGNGEGERGFTVNVGNRGDIGDGNPMGMEVRFQHEYGKDWGMNIDGNA